MSMCRIRLKSSGERASEIKRDGRELTRGGEERREEKRRDEGKKSEKGGEERPTVHVLVYVSGSFFP